MRPTLFRSLTIGYVVHSIFRCSITYHVHLKLSEKPNCLSFMGLTKSMVNYLTDWNMSRHLKFKLSDECLSVSPMCNFLTNGLSPNQSIMHANI